MRAAWIHLRRLAASLMLVAVTAFVLHGGALAGSHRHGPAPTDCIGGHAGVHAHGYVGLLPHHAHGPGGGGSHHHQTSHEHGEAALDRAASHALDGEAATPACCGKVCAVVLQVAPSGLTELSLKRGIALLPWSQTGAGLDPGGLTRPPRTPSIA